MCPVDEQVLGNVARALAQVVAETVTIGSSQANDSSSVCSCVASPRPVLTSTRDSCPPACGGSLDSGGAAEHDEVGHRDVDADARLHAFEGGRAHGARSAGLFASQVRSAGQADPATVGAAAHVALAVGRGRSPRGLDELGDAQASAHDRGLDGGTIGIAERGRRRGSGPARAVPRRAPRAEVGEPAGPCRGGSA